MFRAACLIVLCTLASSSLAEEQNFEDPGYWLEKLVPALTKTSYRGVFVYARGDQVSSMQIAHRFRNGMVEERLVMQDGEAGEIVRKGMEVICVLPKHGRMELTNVIPSGPFAEAFANQLVPVDRWYRPEMSGDDRIAGHDVVRLTMNAKDDLRYSHRLWLERSTGLPLKGKVISSSGEVLEYFHFTSLTISDQLSDQEFMIRTEGREISRTLSPRSEAPAPSTMEGWSLGWKPQGFEPAAAPSSGAGGAVAFSDGLASFSVFVESASGLEMPSGTSRIGATTVYMKRLELASGDFLVTVVGEIPLETVVKVANSVEVDDSRMLGANLP
ncbi:MucB/RseB C-terminal domain-containing protein [Marinobacter sp. CHS3-4]|uniref:MucB/RseB C-terminal domain-containing protein n=1 Tax=Marinobacter sp. CHS3-4 TaxID=3045174 RepID=UPI0024B5E9B8|nr:MucB/RseB C-terminal domain-containing protein [Marinobacter sp. CHS3-4]MDI9246126.1 MucB/RseB C-terminal domain-containing protein [Marinobacter sp. CHS3-4]